MKSTFLIIVSIFLSYFKVNAQHCSFDYSYIMIVEVITEEKQKSINNLKITALDSVNKPIVSGEKILRFWKNPEEKDNLNKKLPYLQSLHFSFAKGNCYLIITSLKNIKKIRTIRIEDNNSDIPKIEEVAIPKESYFFLCSWSPIEQYFSVYPKRHHQKILPIHLKKKY